MMNNDGVYIRQFPTMKPLNAESKGAAEEMKQ